MDVTSFKKIARLLKQVYKELEMESLKKGLDLMSPEYDMMVANAREMVLRKMGFTLEEYREIKQQLESERLSKLNKDNAELLFLDIEQKLKKIGERYIPTNQDIIKIAHDVARQYIKPPQITNQIVKEIKIEKPKIIKETVKITERVEYDDSPLKKELQIVKKSVENIKIPESLDVEKLKEDFRDEFSENFKKNIDILGMPDFRKLAMGLQQQIDDISVAAAGSLDSLTDVVISSPSDDQFLRFDGSNWVNETVAAGTGDVTKVGTPVNNQVGVWTGDGTIEGDAALTFDTTTNTLSTEVLTLTGTGTLNGVDAIDSTTEDTLEAAIDTLANLTSIQGITVTLADAGADAILGWDDSASAYENLTQAEVLAVIGDSTATAKGVVELATDAETVTGTDTARATTPANITAKMAAPGTIGGTTPGVATFTTLNITSFGANWTNAGRTVADLGTVTTADINGGTIDGATIGGSSAGAGTFTTVTVNTNLVLAENAGVVLDAALSADGTYSGIVEAGTAGATLAFGDIVYLAVADSRWELADADAAATAGPVKIGICVLAAAADGSATTILLRGKVRADAVFPALTVSAPAYIGTTAGDIVVAAPSGTGDVVRIIGYGNTGDELYFDPDQTYIELV